LLHAETLLRRGSVTEAYGLASEVSLGEHDLALLARAWRLKGKASYWLGENERALTEQSKAIELASDPVELQEALWGAFLAAQQVNRTDAESFLDQLEASEPLDPSMHLRLAVGRSVAGARSGSFRGAHDLMEATAGFLKRTSDPEVRSSFLAHWSYVEVNRSRYERAHTLAEDAAQHARLLRLGLPLHASLTCRALAEIGMRKFRQASRTVAEMKRVEVELPDPTLRLQTLIVDLKLRLANSDKSPVIADEEPQLADPSVGEFIALRAMAAAVADDPRQAHVLASDALSVSSSAECRLYAAFAKLVADRSTKATDAMTQELLQIVTDAFDRQCLDAYVMGYRACPELLGYALRNHQLREFTKEAVSLARDYAVARDAGLTAPALEPLHELLTKRELEVFGLVCQGFTNKQIAEHLVVSPTTAKVHVYHIMKKLGVKSRMEAILHFGPSEP
jgi:DNA-binding CsgD family transcriptional regulator